VRSPAIMNIKLVRPIEFDFLRVRELRGVGARGHEVGEDGIVLLDGDRAGSVLDYSFGDADCAKDAEGWGGEAEAWVGLC
jgi:hypothetical protein